MAKTITLEVEGTKYVLEFTRDSAKTIEKQGFTPAGLSDTPNFTVPILVHGAFLAHHRLTSSSMIDKIYASIHKKDEFVIKLAEMYSDATNTLFDEPDESAGNSNWEANW